MDIYRFSRFIMLINMLLILLSFSGCKKHNTENNPIQTQIYLGSWHGEFSRDNGMRFNISFDIFEIESSQSPRTENGEIQTNDITGTWFLDYLIGSRDDGGVFTGIMEGNTITGTLESDLTNGCGGDFSGTLLKNQFDGALVDSPCSRNGNFSTDLISADEIIDIDGRYEGQVSTLDAGVGTIVVNIFQSGLNFTGSFDIAFQDKTHNASGEIFGRAIDDFLDFIYNPNSEDDCIVFGSGRINDGAPTSISASYQDSNCSQSFSGNISIAIVDSQLFQGVTIE